MLAQTTFKHIFYKLGDALVYSVEVIRYLQAARYPFVMPVVCRGRKPSDPRGASSTYVFAAQKHSG